MSTESDPGTPGAAISAQPTGDNGTPPDARSWMQPNPNDPVVDTRTGPTSAPSSAGSTRYL